MHPEVERSGETRPWRRPRWWAALVAVLALGGSSPAPAHGQTVGPVLEAIRQGGTWVAIPIDGGLGSVETSPIPTLGLRVRGCARLWKGHSGTWQITAEDHLAEETLTALLKPDESVRFDHRAGARARLSVDVHWSEPRDTTLMLWVGLAASDDGVTASCDPPETD